MNNKCINFHCGLFGVFIVFQILLQLPSLAEAGFNCTEEGHFPHPTNQHKFFWCTMADGSLRSDEYTCPELGTYNATQDVCIPPISPATTAGPTSPITTVKPSQGAGTSSNAISTSEPPTRGEPCQANDLSGMVRCFKNDLENVEKDVKSSNSLQKLKEILQKSLDRTMRIFSQYQNQKNRTDDLNGFDVIAILESIARIVAAELINKTDTMRIVRNETALEITDIHGDYRFPNYSKPAYHVEPWKGLSDVIQIPGEIFRGSTRTYKAISALYLNLKNKVPTQLYSSNKSYIINSHVISSFIFPQIPEPFNTNVIIVLEHLKVLSEGEYGVCAYWDYNLRRWNGQGAWSRRECHVMSERSNETHTTCSCNHLTNFAILMGSENMPTTNLDESVLSVITYIGCALSLFGSVAAIGTLVLFTRGLNSDRNIIHTNLLASIAISQTIFLAGVEHTQNKTQCKLTAIMLHYFYLVSFAWMLCEGFHLYAMVVKVFNVRSRLYHYVAFSWGFPTIIVIISVASRFKEYGTSKWCWISSEYYTLLAFIAPVGVTVLINIVILCMVMKEICRLHMSDTSHIRNVINSTFKTVVVLFPLLGITWVFGLLLFATRNVVFQYLFALFNTLQGFFIFLLHCLFNSEIRRNFKRKKEVWKSLRAFENIRRRLTIAIIPVTSPVTKETTTSNERAETFRKSSKTAMGSDEK